MDRMTGIFNRKERKEREGFLIWAERLPVALPLLPYRFPSCKSCKSCLKNSPLASKPAFAQPYRMIMKKLLQVLVTVTACAICAAAAILSGCASDPANSNGIPHLSDPRAQKLVTAADRLAMVGGPLPDEIENLNPVQVYADHGNIVIALHRTPQGEQGFYIVPTTSSYDPSLRARPGWTFTLVNPTDPYLNSLFQYSRRLEMGDGGQAG